MCWRYTALYMLYYTFSVGRIYVVVDVAHPPPKVVEVVELVEVVEVCSVVMAVHSPVHVILYLQCWSHICCSRY